MPDALETEERSYNAAYTLPFETISMYGALLTPQDHAHIAASSRDQAHAIMFEDSRLLTTDDLRSTGNYSHGYEDMDEDLDLATQTLVDTGPWLHEREPGPTEAYDRANPEPFGWNIPRTETIGVQQAHRQHAQTAVWHGVMPPSAQDPRERSPPRFQHVDPRVMNTGNYAAAARW
jgi:hypothetical protein